MTKNIKKLGLGENEAGEVIEWPLAISGIVTTQCGIGVVGKWWQILFWLIACGEATILLWIIISYAIG